VRKGSVLRYRSLVLNLAAKDLHLKYRSAALGYLWGLLQPLLLIATYSFAFRYVLGIGREEDRYLLFVMVGVLHWNLFSSSVLAATQSVVGNEGLIKKLWFPRLVLPVSTQLFHLAQYGLGCLIILPAYIFWFGVPFGWHLAWFWVVLALFVAFTFGASLLVATSAVFFRDTAHLLENALFVLFWCTPILIHVDRIDEPLRTIVSVGPVAPFVVGLQQTIWQARVPDALTLSLCAAYAAVALAAGAFVFTRNEARFAEEV
jgi:ABC-type polysaccharide/polyol phosphate export permease